MRSLQPCCTWSALKQACDLAFFRSGDTLLVCVVLFVASVCGAATLRAEESLAPFSSIERAALVDMYRTMELRDLECRHEMVSRREVELNRELNDPANQAADSKRSILIQIERTQQELDILRAFMPKKTKKIKQAFSFDPYKPLLSSMWVRWGFLALLVFIFLLVRLRNSRKQGSTLPAPDEPTQNQCKVENTLDGAMPINDIQAHAEYVLLKSPKGYSELIELIFGQAIAWHASDIHMQRTKGCFEIQYRIDGELLDICKVESYRAKEVVSVIKVMASLKFDRSTTALDGRISYALEERTYDLRISIIPTLGAEKVVIRLFDEDQTPYDLGILGFSEKTSEYWTASLLNRHGLLMVVGPAGSGKTTTIYSSLLHIKAMQRGLNVITLEDPVEHRLEGITQIQIDSERGMNYETAFTNILRQDPEVVMLGEIRSPGVARLAVRAGHTGHLVISTVHSFSTLGALDRLLELGAEGYNLYNSLIAVLGQRLVKKVCPHCAQPYQPEDRLVAAAAECIDVSGVRWLRGAGCDLCMGRGYRERIVIDEIIHLNPVSRNRLSSLETQSERRELLRDQRSHSLWQDGVNKAAAGLTTLEEVALMLGDMTESESGEAPPEEDRQPTAIQEAE